MKTPTTSRKNTTDSLTVEELTALERIAALKGRTISRDVNENYRSEGGFGGRLADSITNWAGSWTFILLFFGFLIFWALINSEVMGATAFDPYPFIFLNLVLSMLAAIQAPVILMAANRQAARDRIDAKHDYAVNLKAELEIMALHERVEALRATDIQHMRDLIEKNTEKLSKIENLLAASR